jgi:hypothetical protein
LVGTGKGQTRIRDTREEPDDPRKRGGSQAGDVVIPLVEREVHYAANEMQLLEDSIGRFKKRLAILIGADNNAPSRRKEGRQGRLGKDERDC